MGAGPLLRFNPRTPRGVRQQASPADRIVPILWIRKESNLRRLIHNQECFRCTTYPTEETPSVLPGAEPDTAPRDGISGKTPSASGAVILRRIHRGGAVAAYVPHDRLVRTGASSGSACDFYDPRVRGPLGTDGLEPPFFRISAGCLDLLGHIPMMTRRGFGPLRLAATAPQTVASACSATSSHIGSGRIRTCAPISAMTPLCSPLHHGPDGSGNGAIRTRDPILRRDVLHPTELRSRIPGEPWFRHGYAPSNPVQRQEQGRPADHSQPSAGAPGSFAATPGTKPMMV